MVHTCPRCELRFANDAELTDHLDHDHHANPEQFDRLRYRPADVRPPGRRYLVVANQTLGDEALVARVQTLAGDGAHFHVVVPATPAEGTTDHPDDRGLALATYRARRLIDALQEAGVAAEAEVGVPDPVRAVARALEHEQADEIIVSTLPSGLSHWLRADLPKRLEHKFHLPVSVVTRPT